MSSVIGKTITALGLAAVAVIAINVSSFAGVEVATYAAIGEETTVPFGWLDFCERYRECDNDLRAPRDVSLTPAAMRRIVQINAWVNKNIEPVADMDHHGVLDRWDYPSDGKGDCEDYALLKRRMLIEEGFPREALLMTVVKEKNGDGHSVLTIKTDHGDFVLDNLSDKVRPWARAPYRFVKRQSQQNQNIWVSIGAPTTAPAYVSK